MRYKVSLIMPSFARPKRTVRAIECILNQDFIGYEAFVVGDKCPFIQELIDSGKAEEYIRAAADKGNKMSIFNLPFNYGGYGYQGRNTCVTLSFGDYIMFMDNDDMIEQDHISNYYNAISKTTNDFMYFNTILNSVEERGGIKKIRDSQLEEGKIGHAEIIAKSFLLKKIKEKSGYNHDWDYIKQLIDMGCVSEKSHNKPTYRVMGVGELRENIED